MKLKILSFDGEMLPKLNAMPNPEDSPIMLLSFTANYNIMNNKKKVIFKLNRNDKEVEGEFVREETNDVLVKFNDERRMILGWELLVRNCDVITGYNIAGFDIPYIVDRAKALNMNKLSIGNADDTLWCRKHLSKGRSVTTIGGIKGKILEDVLYVLRRDDASNTIKADFNLKNLKLEVTAKEVLGKEKKDFSIQEMIDYWEKGTNEEKFINYCSVDSELALEFITKFRLLDKFNGLAKLSGKVTQDIIDSQGFGSLVENLLMKEFGKNGRVIPCRGKSFSDSDVDEVESELKGAFVKEPKVGISDHVVIADYASLYPTLMMKNNICYTTVILDNSIPDDPETMNIIRDENDVLLGRFIKPHILKGIVPSILEYLMAERKTAKTEMKKYEKGSIEYLMWDSLQNGDKILMNSFYGYTGEQGAKLYCYPVAASVTGSGQKQIKYTMKMIDGITVTDIDGKQYKLEIIMGDTDSIYVKVIPLNSNNILNREISVRVVSKELEKINATLEKPMKLAFEDYAERVLVTAKKRYTKIIVDEKGNKKVVSKGNETVRREWCNFASESLEKALNIVLFEKNVSDGILKMVDFIRNEAEKLKSGQIDVHKLVLSKQLSKPITSYDNSAVHVKVAIKMKERGHPSEVGDRIQYLIMDNGKDLIGDKAEEAEYVIKELLNKPPEIISSTVVNIQQKDKNDTDIKETVFAFNTINKNRIDYNYYTHKQLFPPIIRLLKSLGVSEELLTADKKQKSMLDF